MGHTAVTAPDKGYCQFKTNAAGQQVYDLSVFQADPFKQGIIAATQAYISNLNSQLTNQSFETISLSQIQAGVITKYSEDAQKQAVQIGQELAAFNAASHSSGLLGSILGYIMGGMMFLVGCVTADPYMMGMGAVSIAMNASGAQQKLEDALPDNSLIKAAVEFGISAGEVAAFGGAGLAFENAVTEGGLAVVADAAGSTVGKLVATRVTSQLSQGLMMNNFWSDFLQGTHMMSAEDAQWAAMAIGITTSFGSAYLAAKNGTEGLLKDALQNKLIEKFGTDGTKYFDNLQKGFSMLQAMMNTAAGGMEIAQSGYMKQEANILDTLSGVQKLYDMEQTGTEMASDSINITQNGAATFAQDFGVIAQTYASLGNIFQKAIQV